MSKPSDKRRDELTKKYPYLHHKKDKCEECGVGEGGIRDENGFLVSKQTHKRLTVHHIDEDITNNHPSNLQTLCWPCHKEKHKKIKWVPIN